MTREIKKKLAGQKKDKNKRDKTECVEQKKEDNRTYKKTKERDIKEKQNKCVEHKKEDNRTASIRRTPQPAISSASPARRSSPCMSSAWA